MRLLVFQHVDCDHPGSFRKLLARDQVEVTNVNFHYGDQIPPLDPFDALWVMGGPMDVWEVEAHPWLVPEKAAIRQWVREMERPFLGLCLGHQLLADALGGACGPLRPPEVGVYDVELTEAGRADALMSGTPAQQKCLQWHSVQVTEVPEDTTVLASSPPCPVQAMRVGKRAWSIQYHVEVEPDTVEAWSKIPAYHDALVTTLGADGFEAMKQETDANMADFLSCAETLYGNFVGTMAL